MVELNPIVSHMAATDVWMDENEWYHGAYVDKPGVTPSYCGRF